MDARDSLSPSTVASSAASVTATTAAAAASAAVTVSPNRDGSSGTTEDDAVLSAAAALAKDAALHFQSSMFTECVEVLNQLLLKKQDDPKVIHNIAIAEYFRDGCSDPRKLLEVLNNVKKKCEVLACASGEQVEAVSNLGNKVVSGSKGSSAANSASIVYTDEFDTSVAILNIAVIWFHLHEYAKALSVLGPLYQNIEPIDETTALHICLLLLEVALACHDASKSATVVFTTTPLCAVCNPWVQNAERYASQSVCINSNNDFGTPSRTYDCYCQPVGACQEKVKTEGYITISAGFGRNRRKSARIGLNRRVSVRIEKKNRRRIGASEECPRESGGGVCGTHFAASVLQRWYL